MKKDKKKSKHAKAVYFFVLVASEGKWIAKIFYIK